MRARLREGIRKGTEKEERRRLSEGKRFEASSRDFWWVDLVGESYQGRDAQLENFSTTGRRVGLEVAEPKTKALKTSREPRTEDFIELGDFLLEEVDRFKYLGSIVSSDASLEAEINARIASASKCS